MKHKYTFAGQLKDGRFEVVCVSCPEHHFKAYKRPTKAIKDHLYFIVQREKRAGRPYRRFLLKEAK